MATQPAAERIVATYRERTKRSQEVFDAFLHALEGALVEDLELGR